MPLPVFHRLQRYIVNFTLCHGAVNASAYVAFLLISFKLDSAAAMEFTAHIDLLPATCGAVLVGTDDTAYCLSVQFPIAYLEPNLYGPSYKKVKPKEAHPYYATVDETAEYVLDSIERSSFSFEWATNFRTREVNSAGFLQLFQSYYRS